MNIFLTFSNTFLLLQRTTAKEKNCFLLGLQNVQIGFCQGQRLFLSSFIALKKHQRNIPPWRMLQKH